MPIGTNIRVYSFAIGIVGDAGVRGTAQQPRLYVGMILILIFAEVLGKYSTLHQSSHGLRSNHRPHDRSVRIDCRSSHELPLESRLQLSSTSSRTTTGLLEPAAPCIPDSRRAVLSRAIPDPDPDQPSTMFFFSISPQCVGGRRGTGVEQERNKKISAIINSFDLRKGFLFLINGSRWYVESGERGVSLEHWESSLPSLSGLVRLWVDIGLAYIA